MDAECAPGRQCVGVPTPPRILIDGMHALSRHTYGRGVGRNSPQYPSIEGLYQTPVSSLDCRRLRTNRSASGSTHREHSGETRNRLCRDQPYGYTNVSNRFGFSIMITSICS